MKRVTADGADERRFLKEGGLSCLSRRRPLAKADLSRREADPPLPLFGGLENPPSVISCSRSDPVPAQPNQAKRCLKIFCAHLRHLRLPSLLSEH